MKVAFIVRSTLDTVSGGDSVQIHETAKHLKKLGLEVDIYKTTETIQYDHYNLLHFFNLIRPADIIRHIHKTKIPFVLTPVWIDYSEYDKRHRKGFAGMMFRFVNEEKVEYFKTIARWLMRRDVWPGGSYLLKGQKGSMREVLSKTAMLLPGTSLEYQTLSTVFGIQKNYSIVPLGVNEEIFVTKKEINKDPLLLLCVARIEGIKNQLNLIRAVNGTKYKLILIGRAAPNHLSYYKQCRKEAGSNISFVDHLPQEKLADYYSRAKVHILPSWYENCGLSTLEAAALQCNVVVSNRGFISEYLGEHAFYCDPSSPDSILQAIEHAANAPVNSVLQNKIIASYTWNKVAETTFTAYQKLLAP